MNRRFVSVVLALLVLSAGGPPAFGDNPAPTPSGPLPRAAAAAAPCEEELKACRHKLQEKCPKINLPPGPIIVIDPDTLTSGSHFQINGSPAVAHMGRPPGYMNENAIGIQANKFTVKLTSLSAPVKIKRFRASFTGTDGNPHTLEIELTSLNTLAWKLDQQVLLPTPVASDQQWPGEWIGPLVPGSVQVSRADEVAVDIATVDRINVQADIP